MNNVNANATKLMISNNSDINTFISIGISFIHSKQNEWWQARSFGWVYWSKQILQVNWLSNCCLKELLSDGSASAIYKQGNGIR